MFTRSATPTLSFRPSDPDGEPVTAVFYVYDADGTMIHDQWVPAVPSGSVATWQVPAGMLQPGRSYRYRATTFDAKDFGDDAWVALRSEHSGRYVDVAGCGYEPGTVVQQWIGNGADCQKFFPWGTGDGYYQFKVRHSGQVLDNAGCGTANANPVITYPQVFDQALNDCQQWSLNRLGGGVYSFTVANAGKVLDQGCGGPNDTTFIRIYDRLDNSCQRWRMENSPPPGVTVQWVDFTVDTTAPGAPLVVSTDYPADNLWHGAAGQAGAFTFTPPSNTTDTAAYLWGLDVTPATEVAADGAGRATASVTPATDGHHVLNVRTKDRAGHLSAITSFAFQVGRAGLVRPADGARVPRRTVLQVDTQPGFTHVKYVYRRGEGAATESDVPPAHLTRSNGSAFGTGFVPLSAGAAVWSAADTVGTAAGVVQVKAVVATNSTGAGAYATAWRTLVIDPDADGAASTEVGPGELNLLTGDFGTTAQDVEEFGLTVSRTSSSRDPRAGYHAQRERLNVNQQKISTDASGFVPVNAAAARSTVRGHTGNDSLVLTPNAGSANSDTYAAVDGDGGALRLGMKPGRRYRLSGWIYVPAATGLAAPDPRGLKVVGYFRTPAGYQEIRSAAPTVTDAWVELTVDLQIPPDATEAWMRVHNGNALGSGRQVFFDDLSVRELTAPFGPAWSTGTAADASGVDYTQLSFEAGTDNTVVKVDTAGGGSVWFTKALDGRFFPEPGAEDLTLTPEGANYRLAELDGTVTIFAQQGGSTAWLVSATTPPVAASTTRYAYEIADDRLRVARVIAPSEAGVGDCTTPTPARGCEAVQYSYATTTTATAGVFGDYLDQVRAVSMWTTDPATGTVSATEVARYAYDNLGRLREVWDPRISPALKTGYEYDADGRVITLIPPGELSWRFDHGQAGPSGDPNVGRLLRVRRAALVQGSNTQLDGTEPATTVVYAVPLTHGAGGPHDLDAAAVASWAQTEAPTDATAVFPPQEPATVSTATAAAPGTNGYRTAEIHYLDGSGRETNTASPGGWWSAPTRISSRSFDRFGNVVRELSARNRDIALSTNGYDSRVIELGLAQADSATRATRLDTQSFYSADGLDKLREITPLRRTVLPEAPDSFVMARSVTEYVYDEAKPDGTAYHLPTTTLGYHQVDGRAARYDPRINRTAYGPVIGGTSGWTLRAPTQLTANLRGQDTGTATAPGGDSEAVTTSTAYDDRGRVVESRTIGATGSDARTTRNVYWTAAANSSDATCGNRPEWAGLVCATRAGGVITGHDGARMPGELPVERVTGYNRYGDATTVTETVAGTTRTTTTGYDVAGRVTSVAVSGGVGVAVPAVQTGYDAVSGRRTVERFADGTQIVSVFDGLGRSTRYTDADAGFTATEYDRFGQPVRVTDSTGAVQTLFYDRTLEPRGLLMRMVDSVAGTYEPRYDIDGQIIQMVLPNQISMNQDMDPAGVPVRRSYSGTYGELDQDFVTSTQVVDINGQKVRQTGPGSDQRYTYDSRRRLTGTADINAANGTCTTRNYGLDARSNRTSKTTRVGATAGVCPTSAQSPTSTISHVLDSADRAQDTGLRYDAFGRVTNLPAVAGELVNTFHVNDLVASQTQGDQRQTWSLDPGMRLRSFRSERLVSGAWTNAVTKVNHYGDSSDEPRWITEDATLPDSLTRYVSGPDGMLVATTGKTAGTTTLQMTNLHGDVMATVPLTTSAPFWGAVTVHDSDEFGNPRTTAAATARYSWLGAYQRSQDGLADTILMGVRLYHPATGRFLSVDPVAGGSDTSYDYCNADPINSVDLDGRWPDWNAIGRWAWENKWEIALTAASFIPVAAPFAWAYRAFRIVKAARAVIGMGGGIRATRATSWLAGRIFVGRGSRRTAVGRISADGLRQWRAPKLKKKLGYRQSNFETRKVDKGRWPNNFHVDHLKRRKR